MIAITIGVVGALTPGYRPLADVVSRLTSSDEPHAMLTRAGFVLYGILVIVGARPLGVYAPGREHPLALLIGGYGAAVIVSGLAPIDPPTGAHSLTSQIHVGAALAGGAMLFAAMLLVARRATLRADRLTAASVAVLATVCVTAFAFARGTPIYGLIELVLLALAVEWLLALAIRLLHKICCPSAPTRPPSPARER